MHGFKPLPYKNNAKLVIFSDVETRFEQFSFIKNATLHFFWVFFLCFYWLVSSLVALPQEAPEIQNTG